MLLLLVVVVVGDFGDELLGITRQGLDSVCSTTIGDEEEAVE